MTTAAILSVDQGTTSTRAVVYDAAGRALGAASRELTQHYPRPGWVEHDPEEIWASVREVVPQALAQAGVEARRLTAIGLTNQRETVVLWERAGGRPVAPAIVWQDRRTADFCRERRADEPWIGERTGLVLDPYFSATKIRWLLDQNAQLRGRAGQLACGTIDSFLIWRLTGGRLHATDATNASRTLLLNIRTGAWDEELLRYFDVPAALLPEVRPSAADFGVTHGLDFLPDGLPILGAAGDQQAALFGQCCFAEGEAKCTYGTGAFFLQHTGSELRPSHHRLLTTLAATGDGPKQYALEGSVFVAGAAVQWLRDGLKLFDQAPAVEELARRSDPDQPVVFVPGFVGLGAPHWVPEARGVLFGLTRGTTAADLGRAVLEGVAYQVADLIAAAAEDAVPVARSGDRATTPAPVVARSGDRATTPDAVPVARSGDRATTPAPVVARSPDRATTALRVDGGMARNAWFLQCQADVLGLPVAASPHSEATARGAAFLAGWKAGVWPDFEALRRLDADARIFTPALAAEERERRLKLWRRAVRSVIDFYTGKT